MIGYASPDVVGSGSLYGQEFFERGRMQRALQRIQKPEDLVGTVIVLTASASDFITGASILVDGGHHRQS